MKNIHIKVFIATVLFLAAYLFNPPFVSGEQNLDVEAGATAQEGEGESVSLQERFNPDQLELLRAGEAICDYVIEDSADEELEGYARAVVIINAPVSQCFNLFSDFGSHSLFFPHLSRTEVIEERGASAVVRKVIDYRLVEVEYYVLFTVDEDEHCFYWTLDPDRESDFEVSEGFFRFEPAPEETTLFTYAITATDTGFYVPGFIRDYLSSRDLPAVALNVKRRMESGGEWTK